MASAVEMRVKDKDIRNCFFLCVFFINVFVNFYISCYFSLFFVFLHVLNNFFSYAKCFVDDSNENDIDLSRIIDFDAATNLLLKQVYSCAVVDACLIWTDLIILILRPVRWDKLDQSTHFKGKLHKWPIKLKYC